MAGILPARAELRKQFAFLASEFVVIVLGVLTAFAVEEWRNDVELRDIEAHLLSNLLTDLREDRYDFDDYTSATIQRRDTAEYLLALADGRDVVLPAGVDTVSEAFFSISIWPLLQTATSALAELNTIGGGLALSDRELRSDIQRYYATAADRRAVNGLIAPEIVRLRVRLEDLGVSYQRVRAEDVPTILADRRLIANIESIASSAEFASFYVDDAKQMNAALILQLEGLLAED